MVWAIIHSSIIFFPFTHTHRIMVKVLRSSIPYRVVVVLANCHNYRTQKRKLWIRLKCLDKLEIANPFNFGFDRLNCFGWAAFSNKYCKKKEEISKKIEFFQICKKKPAKIRNFSNCHSFTMCFGVSINSHTLSAEKFVLRYVSYFYI